MKAFRLIQALFGSVPRYRAIDCFERVRSGAAVLVDVREPDEWSAGVAEHAVLLPLRDLSGPRVQWKPFLAAHRERELLFYCGAGVRSGMAARILAREGFRTANAGSFKEWAAADWPIVSAQDN